MIAPARLPKPWWLRREQPIGFVAAERSQPPCAWRCSTACISGLKSPAQRVHTGEGQDPLSCSDPLALRGQEDVVRLGSGGLCGRPSDSRARASQIPNHHHMLPSLPQHLSCTWTGIPCLAVRRGIASAPCQTQTPNTHGPWEMTRSWPSPSSSAVGYGPVGTRSGTMFQDEETDLNMENSPQSRFSGSLIAG